MPLLKYIIKNYKKFYIFPFWLILFLLSLIYRLIITIQRKKGYIKRYSQAFLLAIGNITTGGTGKTEVASFLAAIFKKKTSIILRGYKGNSQQEAQIVSKNSDVQTVGDEALLLAERFKETVIISKKKRKGVELAVQKKKCLIILDDGFQHWDLKRDMNLVLIDYTNPFGNYNLLPAGILREPLTALKYADGILITKYGKKLKDLSYVLNKLSTYDKSLSHLMDTIRKFNPDCPIFVSDYKLNKILYKGKPFQLNKVKNKRLILLSGIGNPDYFISQVKEYLRPVKLETLLFSDHYYYTEKDISLITKKLKEEYDYVITTEKDFVKLKKFNLSPMVFQIRLNIFQKDKFVKFIKDRIKSTS